MIKWVIDKVTFNDKGEVFWRLDGMCDSMWGSNKEDGKSVTQHLSCFVGVPVTQKSKTQLNVSLSSSKTECLVSQ